MKIFILTDLEGPALVDRLKNPDDPEDTLALKRHAKRMLTGEVNAAVAGIRDADPAAEIVVWDGHGSGGIEPELFVGPARLISRGPIRPPYHLDSSYNALFFVGQHAMAGTPAAPMCHSYSSLTIESITLNGRPMGEFGCRAAMAGTLGVPAAFIAGDDKAVAEARALVPAIHAATVKWGLADRLCMHLSHPEACRLIRETAAEAARTCDRIQPFRLDPPYEQEIRLKDGADPQSYLAGGYTAVAPRTFRKTSSNICELRV